MDQVYSISILVLAAALSLPFLSLIRSKKARIIIGLIILAVYIYGNLNETILGRRGYSKPQIKAELFWSYRASLKIVDGSLRIERAKLLIEIILNILLYVPVGYILPFLIPSVFCPMAKGTHHHWVGLLRVMAVGLLCSAATEISQYYFRIGLFEFDDIFNNTLGAGMGFILYRVVMRMLPLNRSKDDIKTPPDGA